MITVKELKEYLSHYDDATEIYVRMFAEDDSYKYRYGEIVELIKDEGILEFGLDEVAQ